MTAPIQAAAADYRLGAAVPGEVARPESIDELAGLLRRWNADGRAVVPWGGGVRQELGRPPARYDVALDVTALNAVIEYEPADLTVTVQAGMRIGTLQTLLAEHGQMVTLESPFDSRATVGGTLAAGLAGPLSHALGGPRERLIGLRAVLAEGSAIHGGGRVVKNVAGYDLPRLFVGSLGTLGVITEASFKLAALPTETATAVLPLTRNEDGFRVAGAIRDRNLPVRALEIGDTGGRLVLQIDISGRRLLVDRLVTELRGIVGATLEIVTGDDHRRLWEAWAGAGFVAPASAVVRIVVPASKVADVVKRMPERGETRFQARPSTGVIRAMLTSPDAARVTLLRGIASTAGGHAIIERGPEPLRREISPWDAVQGHEVMQRLRTEFDPRCTLNPGRYVDGVV